MRALLVVYPFLATGVAFAASPMQSDPGAMGAGSEQVSVKLTDPARVVFVVHIGPYWTVGPKFAELREYMLKHGQPGPIYARYLDGPGGVPATSLRTEVGFFVQGSHDPEPPFEMAERSSELVATMVVDRPFATVSRYYAVLRRWAAGRDYAPVGPVTEIYALPAGSDSDARPTEVQMAIVKVEPPPEPRIAKKEQPDALPEKNELPDIPPPAEKLAEYVPTPAEAALGKAADEGAHLPVVDAPVATPQMPTVDGVAKKERNPSLASNHDYYEPVHSAPPDRTSPTIVDDSDVKPAVVEVPSPEPATSEPPSVERSAEPKVQRSFPPLVPIDVLVQRHQYDRVAEQLLPDDRLLAPHLEVWLGQVMYRVTAITGALERRGKAGDNAALIALGNAIDQRYRQVSKGFHADPLSQPTWRLDQRSDPQGEEKKSIMRALELIMGRLAVGGLDPSSNLTEVVEILQRVQDVMQAG